MQTVGEDVPKSIHHKVIRKRSKISVADVVLLAQWATRKPLSVQERAVVDKMMGWIDHHAQLTPLGRRHFQDLLAKLALKTRRPITLPVNELPFWQRVGN